MKSQTTDPSDVPCEISPSGRLANRMASMDAYRGLVMLMMGMNSIAAYMIAHLFVEFFSKTLPLHLGRHSFEAFGPAYEPLLLGAGVLLIEWLILWWMYRRRIFLRV